MMKHLDVFDIANGYAQGLFLMAGEDGTLGWYSSRERTLIPLDDRFHVPRSLRRALNSGRFEVRINGDFAGTVEGCANREETWISDELKDVYHRLNEAGFAYSFETWHEGELAGGILGIVLGGAFIGESMFYRVPEASKVAMVRLVEHLRNRKFTLYDAQLMNPHLERFGAYNITPKQYQKLLDRALQQDVFFDD
ncbi:leucyl/phenylalanyl-tRNA--protein transferase [Deinococcus cellulosilyticus]|uniref:Leucyl/phenylalanyl-tRNA--protein transferase n=1 Tax=Deinococcus cellulosilyticus (strain DSM 18568 / NBRC 106333 / KACC 11606 / 5516J-15) TaxID=1223518 RepID=A0A511NAM6_DEIC1|nr:leucyl/phenylalanyl-tRNA--protein transferase [Deinococcus cellulosilyticus]GEM49884.1 leucyl/phenylalanyl-tRNA--protein transferase [Deinococcus cellulosilyticus NBRC 106333 = KACC 11606]